MLNFPRRAFDDFEGAMSLCERLAVHKQSHNPNDPDVASLNKAADILQRETAAHRFGWEKHKADCTCEACYTANHY